MSTRDCREEPTVLFRMSFPPNDALVSVISRAVAELAKGVFADGEHSASLRMAAHELAENITKYSTGTMVDFQFEIREELERYVVTLSTKNETSEERLQEVQRRLKDLADATNVIAHYDFLARRNAGREGVSGLGLARIRAEGDIHLDCSTSGRELTIVARSSFPKQ